MTRLEISIPAFLSLGSIRKEDWSFMFLPVVFTAVYHLPPRFNDFRRKQPIRSTVNALATTPQRELVVDAFTLSEYGIVGVRLCQ